MASINGNSQKLFAIEKTDEQNSSSYKTIDIDTLAQKIKSERLEINKIDKNLETKKIEHEIWELKLREKIYEWHYISSIIIFIGVSAIVIVGIYFSYIQFTKSFASSHKNSNDRELPETTIKIGKGEVEISSSIIGLLILILSLAFFYLYLASVYPVEELPSNNIEQEISNDKADIPQNEKATE